MNIIVTAYDAGWPAAYQHEALRIKEVLGGNLLQIFHIGSTSIPGLKAKPIIDVLPVVSDIELVDSCQQDFSLLGYEYLGEFGMPGRRYLRKGGDHRTHQIHIFQYDNVTDILRHLAFRDYLRCHPHVCAAYGELKSRLALQHPKDLDAYCIGKESLVQQIERDALQWYWKERN